MKPHRPAGDDPSAAPQSAGGALERLQQLIETLRGPAGCPWDRAQTLPDLRAYVLEEAHEVAAAIDLDQAEPLREELGDLAFQLAFIAALAADRGWFSLGDAIEANRRKMVERHPHVFAAESPMAIDRETVEQQWQRQKQQAGRSVLDGVPGSLPALTAALRLSQRAAGVGFDWPSVGAVWSKVEEELTELRAQLSADGEQGTAAVRGEIGDLLFALSNLARHVGIDPEAALAEANLKFRRRFRHVERRVAAGATTLDELEAAWQEAKRLGL